jgi:ketosteroid isomerase-like protein
MPFTSSSPEANKLLRNAWVALADAKFEEASTFASEALKKDSEFGMAHAFVFLDEQAVKEEKLKKSLGYRLSPDETTFINGLLASQQNEAVASYFDPLLAKFPKDYYLNLLIMFHDQQINRKIEIGEKIVKRNPKFAPAYNLLGYGYMAQNNMANAEANFNKYLSLSPKLANAYDSKADYLMRVGKIDEAIAMFDKAAEMGLTSAKGKGDVAKAKRKYSAPSEKDKQEIMAVISASAEAYKKGDVDAIMKCYADQAMEFPPNQVVNAGTGNIRRRVQNPFRNGTFVKYERSVESIEGAGPIAVVSGRTENALKTKDNLYENKIDDIFLFRKQDDGSWKILVHHWLPVNKDAGKQVADDSAAVRSVIDKWSFVIKPGEVVTQQHLENLAALHSPQGVEIIPNQQSFIGLVNSRVRWSDFPGMTWAQFTGLSFDVNDFKITPAGGFKKAIAWGIGDHSNYWKGSTELSQYLFPWAMILSKEEDDQWRILVYHFYLD